MNNDDLKGTACVQLILPNHKEYFLQLKCFDEGNEYCLQATAPELQNSVFQSIILNYPDYALVLKESRRLVNLGDSQNAIVPFAHQNGFLEINCDPDILNLLLEKEILVYSMRVAHYSNLPEKQSFDYRFECQKQENSRVKVKTNIQVCS